MLHFIFINSVGIIQIYIYVALVLKAKNRGNRYLNLNNISKGKCYFFNESVKCFRVLNQINNPSNYM